NRAVLGIPVHLDQPVTALRQGIELPLVTRGIEPVPALPGQSRSPAPESRIPGLPAVQVSAHPLQDESVVGPMIERLLVLSRPHPVASRPLRRRSPLPNGGEVQPARFGVTAQVDRAEALSWKRVHLLLPLRRSETVPRHRFRPWCLRPDGGEA